MIVTKEVDRMAVGEGKQGYQVIAYVIQKLLRLGQSDVGSFTVGVKGSH